jgi:hypothetical protein
LNAIHQPLLFNRLPLKPTKEFRKDLVKANNDGRGKKYSPKELLFR